MTQDEFQNILVRLMKYGLEIKMFIESDVLWFDLNTQMKSHLHLSFNKETNAANYRARYDEKGTIEYWGGAYQGCKSLRSWSRFCQLSLVRHFG